MVTMRSVVEATTVMSLLLSISTRLYVKVISPIRCTARGSSADVSNRAKHLCRYSTAIATTSSVVCSGDIIGKGRSTTLLQSCSALSRCSGAQSLDGWLDRLISICYCLFLLQLLVPFVNPNVCFSIIIFELAIFHN